jgi:vesicular inhibitory amino acid transporter
MGTDNSLTLVARQLRATRKAQQRNNLTSPLLFPRSPKKPSPCIYEDKSPQVAFLASECGADESLEKLPYSLSDRMDTLSLPEAIFGLLNAMVGLSVLSLPYAFSLVGISVGLPVLFVVIAIMRHTGLLVGRSLRLVANRPDLADVPAKCRDFAFLARAAFGEAGGSIIGIMTGIEVWCALIAFMAFETANSEFLFPSISRASSTALNCVLAAGCALLPMKVFTYVSLASSLAVLVTGVSVVVACAPALLATPVLPDNSEGIFDTSSVHIWSLAKSIGIIVFCFAGHPCFPVMHECLSDKKDYSRVVNVSFFLSLVFYCAFGSIGSITFGRSVQQSVIQSLADLTGAHAAFWQYLAAVATFVKVQLTAPLLLNTILVALWPVPLTTEAGGNGKFLLRASLLLVLSVISGVIALRFADDVGVLASLTGNLLVMISSVLFPVLAFETLSYQNGERNTQRSILHAAIFGVGCLMAVGGTVLTVQDYVSGRQLAS